MGSLDEDNMVEAWLLMRLRAGLRGARSRALLEQGLQTCGVCGGWRGRQKGIGPVCSTGWCTGEPTRSTVEELGTSDTCMMEGEILCARRTAKCFGGWEYLMTRTDGHRWVPHTRMPTGAARRASMLEAQTRRMPHSLRDAMEMESGARDTGSLGRMQIAISGMKSDPQTETHLMNLVEFFRTYSRAQLGVEMQGAEWPNLRELSRDDGYRGPRWLVEGDMSYYRGGRESELDGSERSCMSLAPRLGTWEERLPLGVRVRADEIGAAIARGVAPPHAPHEQRPALGGTEMALARRVVSPCS